MTNWHDDADRAGIENIVKTLREPVRLDESFEVRVMSAVHAEALARVDAAHTEQRVADETSGWWRRTYTVRVSTLAIAASIVAVVLVGAATFANRGWVGSAQQPVALQAPAAPATENVHFILVNGTARQVWLVGDFNGWSKTETPLARSANGSAWTTSLPLARGRHEYAFIVVDDNGERWIADPLTTVVRDEFGTESSVLHVGRTEGALQPASS